MPEYRTVTEVMRERARKRREVKYERKPEGQAYWDRKIADQRLPRNERIRSQTEDRRRHATRTALHRFTLIAAVPMLVLAVITVPLLMRHSESSAYLAGVRLVWLGATYFLGALFFIFMTAGFGDDLTT